MSTERNGKWVGFACDSCYESTEEFDDFDTLLASSKRLGWKVYQEDGEWTHKCPSCAEGPRQGKETDLERAKRLLG